MEDKEDIFRKKINELGLRVEDRDYDEDLYNLVNGLEEEEVYNKYRT